MDTNTKHLLRQWVVALFFGALTTVGVVAAIWRGEWMVPSVVAAVVVLIRLQVLWSRRKALRLFLENAPEPAVAYYRTSMSKLPNGTAFAAYMCGLAYAFYGEYDKARDELAEIAWNTLPPMYEGLRTYVLSTIAMLDKRDFAKALDLALEARDLCGTSSVLPGAARSRLCLEAHVLACELLDGRANQSVAETLESKLKKLRGIDGVLPSWCLVQYYESKGQQENAAIHMMTLRRLVPSCKPLIEPARIAS